MNMNVFTHLFVSHLVSVPVLKAVLSKRPFCTTSEEIKINMAPLVTPMQKIAFCPKRTS